MTRTTASVVLNVHAENNTLVTECKVTPSKTDTASAETFLLTINDDDSKLDQIGQQIKRNLSQETLEGFRHLFPA